MLIIRGLLNHPSVEGERDRGGLLGLGAFHRRGRTYGYQVRADLKPGSPRVGEREVDSIYHALKAMAGEGLLRARDQSSDAAARATEYTSYGERLRGVSRGFGVRLRPGTRAWICWRWPSG